MYVYQAHILLNILRKRVLNVKKGNIQNYMRRLNVNYVKLDNFKIQRVNCIALIVQKDTIKIKQVQVLANNALKEHILKNLGVKNAFLALRVVIQILKVVLNVYYVKKVHIQIIKKQYNVYTVHLVNFKMKLDN